MFGFRRQAAGTGAIVLLLGLAWISLALGSTFKVALTIFSVLIWACVGLVFAYMVLFRNVKVRLFRDDAVDDSPVPSHQVGFEEVPEGTMVELREGDTLVRGDGNG